MADGRCLWRCAVETYADMKKRLGFSRNELLPREIDEYPVFYVLSNRSNAVRMVNGEPNKFCSSFWQSASDTGPAKPPWQSTIPRV